MISWKFKKQISVTLSTCKAEFITISLASQEALYLRALLRTMTELESLKNPTTIHCDNQSSIVLAKNQITHQSLKYWYKISVYMWWNKLRVHSYAHKDSIFYPQTGGCVVVFVGELVGYQPSTNCQQIFIDFPISSSSRLTNHRWLKHIWTMATEKAFLFRGHIFYITQLKTRWLPKFQQEQSSLSGGSLVWFNGISTIVGYVMPNLVLYIYIYIYIWFVNSI